MVRALTKLKIYKNHMGPERSFLEMKDEYNGIILGSTYPYWDFQVFAKKNDFFNAALPAQTLSYDFRILKQYSSRIKKGSLAFICIMPCSFLVDEYKDLTRGTRYYYFLEKDNIYKWSSKRNLKATILPFARLLTNKDKKPILQNQNHKIASANRMSDWCREFKINDMSDAIKDESCIDIMNKATCTLDSIILYALSVGLNPVLVIMPVSDELKSIIPEDYFEKCVIKNVQKANRGRIPVYDFFHEDKLDIKEYYANADCMNEDGQNRLCLYAQDILKGVIKNMKEKTFENKLVELSNGIKLPLIGFGTGVVKRYYRNKPLLIKDNIKPILGSIKHRRLSKKLIMDLKGSKIVNESFQHGFRLFDSGRIYGHSEVVIGEGLKSFDRSSYFISTKISDMDIERDCSPNTVMGNFELSLKYLQIPYTDLYLLHWPHGDWINIYNQMEDIYELGKTKAIGVCNFNIEHFEKLLDNCRIVPHVCQTELHPLNSKKELREYCKERGIVIMAHTPTGRMCEKIRQNEVLSELARKYNKSIAQIIIRWHIQNCVIPIVATTSTSHMDENLDVFDFQLNQEDMKLIEGINENYVMLNADGIDNPNYIYNL